MPSSPSDSGHKRGKSKGAPVATIPSMECKKDTKRERESGEEGPFETTAGKKEENCRTIPGVKSGLGKGEDRNQTVAKKLVAFVDKEVFAE